jgi:hypothetical protein
MKVLSFLFLWYLLLVVYFGGVRRSCGPIDNQCQDFKGQCTTTIEVFLETLSPDATFRVSEVVSQCQHQALPSMVRIAAPVSSVMIPMSRFPTLATPSIPVGEQHFSCFLCLSIRRIFSVLRRQKLENGNKASASVRPSVLTFCSQPLSLPYSATGN